MKTIESREEFERFVEQNRFVVVMFCDSHCPACVKFERQVDGCNEEIEKMNPPIPFIKIHCDTVPDLTKDIRFVPHISLFYEGEMYTISKSYASISAIKKWIDKFIFGNKILV